MKEFCFEAHAHFYADDTAGACRKLRDHFDQLARLFDGTLRAEDQTNVLNMAAGEIVIKPAHSGDMNA